MTAGRVLRVDPHVHSRDSYDSTARVPDILARASEVGLDAVAVTDHDRIAASRRAAELAPEYGLVGIPGVEVSTADGHLLALGVRERPPAGRPFGETVAAVRAAGGLAVVPHPFQRLRHGVRKSVVDDCDGIETFNACSLVGYRNRSARAFADRHDYPRLGGSDAHRPALVGRAYTEVELRDGSASGERTQGAATPADPTPSDPTAEAILSAVADGRTKVRGRRAAKRHYVRKYARNAALGVSSLL